MANAIHRGGGLLRSLQGWHESLDAKAFRQEQAAAHLVTTGLILATGAMVGFAATAVFSLLVSIVEGCLLW